MEGGFEDGIDERVANHRLRIGLSCLGSLTLRGKASVAVWLKLVALPQIFRTEESWTVEQRFAGRSQCIYSCSNSGIIVITSSSVLRSTSWRQGYLDH